LAAATRRFLSSHGADELAEWLALWPTAPTPRPVTPATLPVLRWLPAAVRSAPAPCDSLAAALAHASADLVWRQTYAASEVGQDFLASYGWAEVIGNRGALGSDRLAVGFLLLGPRTLYPSHSHSAEEIYVPLSGDALWQRGEEPWLARGPGLTVHHESNQAHAIRTVDAPLLALYLWRGAGLHDAARLATHRDAR
jgi:hypothetical protein